MEAGWRSILRRPGGGRTWAVIGWGKRGMWQAQGRRQQQRKVRHRQVERTGLWEVKG